MRYPKLGDIENEKDRDGNVICRNCTNIVLPGRRRNYCSEKCMIDYNRNNSWFWVRKDILRRDHYTCSICRQRLRKRFLDVDHIIPVRMGGTLFEKANLRTLCKDCHKAKSKLDAEALR